jgi:hypothetical protein
MGKAQSKKITYFELIKVEKKFNGQEQKYFYNLGLEGIEQLLLLESDERILDNLIGSKISYKINEDNMITHFEFI